MSLKLSSLLKLSIASAVLLTVGACKGADKGQGVLKSESSALNLSKSEASVFAKHFKTAPCDVDEQEALGALAGLGMGESGDDGAAFDSRKFKNGVVTYRGLRLTEDNADDLQISFGTMAFHCPQMVDNTPSFNRLDISDIYIKDDNDGVELKAESFNLANPSVDALSSFNTSSLGDIFSQSANDGIGFGAISMTGVEFTAAEGSGTLKAMSWGVTRDEDGKGIADLTVDDADFVISPPDGSGDVTLDFEGMSIRDLNLGPKQDENLSRDQIMSNLFENINLFDKPYDEIIIESMKMDSDIFSIDFAGLEGKTSEKGEVITTRSNMKPMTINLKPALGEDPSMAQAYGILQSLDMETITLSGSSVSKLDAKDDSVSVTNGLFIIDDVMRWNFEYDVEGVNAMMGKIKDLEANGANADPLELYDAIKLRNFRMTIEDNSIVEKGLTLATQMTGQSETQIKLMLTGAVFMATSQAQNEIQAEVYSETAEAFADFVKKGGTLTIEANPPAPFSFAPFLTGDADTIDPASLGFSASQSK